MDDMWRGKKTLKLIGWKPTEVLRVKAESTVDLQTGANFYSTFLHLSSALPCIDSELITT
jgi:hypothetical protein